MRRWSEEVQGLAALVVSAFDDVVPAMGGKKEEENADAKMKDVEDASGTERAAADETKKAEGEDATTAAAKKQQGASGAAPFVQLALQVALEQPLKTPFVAAAALVASASRPEVARDLLAGLASGLEGSIRDGRWREVKLYLRLAGCLHGMLAGDGMWPLLEELFDRAVELQTKDEADVSAPL